MDKQEMIDEIMDWFEFEKVHKVMEALDWTWATVGAIVPTIQDLRRSAREQLHWAYDGLEKHGGDNYFTGSGGFFASAHKLPNGKVSLSLKFAVSEWTAGDLD